MTIKENVEKENNEKEDEDEEHDNVQSINNKTKKMNEMLVRF